MSVAANALQNNGGSRIRDAKGTDAVLDHGAVAADAAHRVDSTAPQFASAAVRGTTLEITFDETMTESPLPAASRFTVSVGGSSRTVSSLSVSGKVAKLTLASAVTSGQTVTVAYTQPPSGAVMEDAVGNELANFGAQSVTNNTGDESSLVRSVTLTRTGASTYEFSLLNWYGSSQTEHYTGFSWGFVDTVSATCTGVAKAGTVNTANAGDTARQTISGNAGKYLCIFGEGKDSNTNHRGPLGPLAYPTVALSLNSAGADNAYSAGDLIEVTADFGYVVNVSPASSSSLQVAMTLNSGVVYASYHSGTGTSKPVLRYTVKSTDSDTDGVYIGANRLETGVNATVQDANGTAADLKHAEVPARTTHRIVSNVPVLLDARVKGKMLTLDFDRAMKETSKPAASAFAVTVAGSARSVSSYTITGTYANLTLASAVEAGETVTVAYTQPGSPPVLEDTSSAGLPSFSAYQVTNNTGKDADALVAHLPDAVVKRTSLDTTSITVTNHDPSDPDSYASRLVGYSLADTSTSRCPPVQFARTVSFRSWTRWTVTGKAGKWICTWFGVEGTNYAKGPGAQISYPPPSLRFGGAGSDGAWRVGEHLDVTADFGYDVTVTGTPRIAVVVGSSTRYATYHKGSGTEKLVFRYTVVAADSDTDGVSLGANALAHHGGSTIVDANSKTAIITHAAVPASTRFRVDNTAPGFSKAAVRGPTLQVFFNEAMRESHLPGADAFTVMVQGSPRTVSSFTVSGAVATLTLSRAVNSGQNVTVAYTDPGKGRFLTDATGNKLANFTAQSVTNNSGDMSALIRDVTLTRTGAKTYQFSVLNWYGTSSTEYYTGFSWAFVNAVTDSCSGATSAGTVNTANAGDTATATITGNADKYLCIFGLGKDNGQNYRGPLGPLSHAGPILSLNSAGDDDAYYPSDLIEVTADFGYAVDVSGTPRIALSIGTNTRYATYHGGSGTKKLTFRYTVTISDSDTNGIGIAANSLANHAGSKIEDSGDTAAVLTHPAFASGEHKVINTVPTVSAARAKGTALTVEFSTAMKEASKPAASAFSVSAGGSAVTVSSYTLTGKYANLTLASAVTATQTVTVSYAKPTSGAVLEDAAGHDLPSFSAQAVTNNTGQDSSSTLSPPTLTRTGSNTYLITVTNGVDAGTTIFDVLAIDFVDSATSRCDPFTRQGSYFDGNLTPQTFTRTITGNAGKYVCLAGYPSSYDASIYTLRGPVGPLAYPNVALSLNHAGSDNVYVAGDPIEVTASFGFNVDVTGTPRIGLTIGSNTRYATYNRGSGTSQIVFRYTAAAGDNDASGVSIAANSLANHSGSTMQDASDTDAVLTHSALAADSTRKVDTAAPTFSSATASGTTVTVTFSEAMDTTSTPPASAFTVTVNGSARTVNSYTLSGSQATLTLASAVSGSDSVTVAYTKPPSGQVLKDLAGNELANFGGQGVTAPMVSSASVDGDTLTILFTSPLKEASKPAASNFSVTVAGASRGISSYTIKRATLTMTLALPVAEGETVTVGYTKPGSGTVLEDPSGREVASFSGETVTNVTDTTQPVASFSPGDGGWYNADSTAISITFNKPVYSNSAGTTAFTASSAKNLVTLKQTTALGANIAFTASAANTGSGATEKTVFTVTPSGTLTNGGSVYVAVGNGYYDAAGKQGGAASAIFKVDTTAPTVSISPANGNEAAGDVNVTLSFNEAVYKNATGGAFFRQRARRHHRLEGGRQGWRRHRPCLHLEREPAACHARPDFGHRLCDVWPRR